MTSQRVPVGIRFKEAGKIYYFDAGGIELDVGNFVVVETSHGKEIGRVVVSPDQVLVSEIKESLKPILRMADIEDLERSKELKERAKERLDVARRRAIDDELKMRIIAADYSLEGDLLSLYYTADDRVDFRPLAQDLSEQFETKVQLLQIGERDRAKIIDGIGRCGERLCCSSWLTHFPTVSIKQAKEQDLPLNPSKLSGACGRLLCCLTYEYDQYKEIKGGLPKAGTRLSTPTGEARVLKINVPKEIIELSVDGVEDKVEIPIIEFRLMYGTAMRPKELTEDFEKHLMARDAAKAAATQAAVGSLASAPEATGQTPSGPGSSAPARERRPRSQQQQKPRPQQQQQQSQGQPQASSDKPRRRRRRRGGRGRRRGGQGGGGQSGGGQGSGGGQSGGGGQGGSTS